MKTRSIARAGMLCAVYGVFLLVNTFTGLMIENVFPFILSLPILLVGLEQPRKISFCALIAMIVLSFMLGSFTTWVIGISYLMAGWIFGQGVQYKIPMLTSAFWCEIILGLSNYLQLTLWAAVFGFDAQENMDFLAQYLPFISWQTFLIVLACLYSLWETIAVGSLAILVVLRKEKNKADFAFLFHFRFTLSKNFGILFLFVLALWLVNIQGSFLPSWLSDLLFLFLCLGTIALTIKGCEGLLQRPAIRKNRWLVTLIVCCAILPPICLIEALYGLVFLFKPSLT